MTERASIWYTTRPIRIIFFLILRGKQKEKFKTKTHPNTKFFPIFFKQSEQKTSIQRIKETVH